jgi:lipoate-protein ligase A
VGEGKNVGRSSYKAAKGLIKVNVHVQNGKIGQIQISGDFFMYPEDGLWDLESTLLGTSITREDILSKVKAFYQGANVLTPGVIPEDFTEAIVRGIHSITA